MEHNQNTYTGSTIKKGKETKYSDDRYRLPWLKHFVNVRV